MRTKRMIQPAAEVENLLFCRGHQQFIAINQFDVNPKTGLPFSRCRKCRAKGKHDE